MNRPCRREFLRRTAVTTAALAIPAWLRAAPATSRDRPNLLFILADDQRADSIAALGNPNIQTPTLDRLASRGTSFSRAYTMGSMVGAVCLPSRTMLLTGRSLFHLARAFNQPYAKFAQAMRDKTEGRDWALLPRVLAAAGYETFHIGKPGNECRAAIQAFDHSITRADTTPAERALSSEKHADAVIEFLGARESRRPFFIYMAPPVPHDPRIAPKQFMDLYDAAKIPLPPAYAPIHPFDNGEMTVRDEKLAPWPRTPQIIRRHLADYYAAITCLDHHIGRIIDTLPRLGQLDHTIVIFASDNGLSLGEHGLLGKQNLYEFGGMHVPLLIAGPGIPSGRSDALVYLFDLFPTLCDLASAPIPPVVEAKSLLPVLTGRSPGVREHMFTAYRNGQRAVRDDRWKLIRYPLIDKTQLFDLQNDPRELNDLSAIPAHAARVKDMTALLARLQREYSDPAPLTVPDPKPAAWQPPA